MEKGPVLTKSMLTFPALLFRQLEPPKRTFLAIGLKIGVHPRTNW